MTPIVIKSFAAVAAVAGLAFAAVESPDAYDGEALKTLSEADIAGHAERVFARADMDASGTLDADEYTALSVVTAELARLNGFVVIEREDEPARIEIATGEPASLPEAEHIRIAAVAQTRFYGFAGDDGVMTADEFAAAQAWLFASADFNNNGQLAKRELAVFAKQQASLASGV